MVRPWETRYFVICDSVNNADADGDGPNSITLVAGGATVGSAAVALLGPGRDDAADVHH